MVAAENLADLAREGYLPADLNTDDGVVLLTKVANNCFQEAWYGNTVANVNAARPKIVPFHAMVEQFADPQECDHLRLIAHTSRCGSTLLANLLSLRPTTMVLKEPDFVTIPARKIAVATPAAAAQNFDSLMNALINFSCHAAAAAQRELVIKLSSWTSPTVLASLRNRSNTTWLLMWREPEQVVASNAARPPSWGRNPDTEEGRAARRLTGVADAAGTAEFYANIWSRIVDSFTATERDIRWRSLEYQELTSDKAGSFLAVESWFDLANDAGLPDEFEQESRRYSKGSPMEVFEPKNAHRRTPLKSDDERAVCAITEPAIKTLREDKYRRRVSPIR